MCRNGCTRSLRFEPPCVNSRSVSNSETMWVVGDLAHNSIGGRGERRGIDRTLTDDQPPVCVLENGFDPIDGGQCIGATRVERRNLAKVAAFTKMVQIPRNHNNPCLRQFHLQHLMTGRMPPRGKLESSSIRFPAVIRFDSPAFLPSISNSGPLTPATLCSDLILLRTVATKRVGEPGRNRINT